MNSVVTQRFIECHDKLREDNVIRSSRQFALSLDYLPQSLSEIMNGRRDVTIELLRKAVETYRFNPVYLYTGEGPLFFEEGKDEDFRVLTVVTDDENNERIVHVPIPAQAGYTSEGSDPEFIEELPTFTLPGFKYKVGTHRSFDVAGDSMEPSLREGDKVICGFVEPEFWETSLKDGHVYVVVTVRDVVVKRIINHLSTDRQLELHSDNSFYRPYPVELEEVREIWRVEAVLSPFLSGSEKVDSHELREEMESLRQTVNRQSQLINQLNETIEKLLKTRRI